jgi:hypothetical protein
MIEAQRGVAVAFRQAAAVIREIVWDFNEHGVAAMSAAPSRISGCR